MTDFDGITVRQSRDDVSLSDVYPLHPVGDLTDEQESALRTATDRAMEPLVEAAWERRNVNVRWIREPRLDARGIIGTDMPELPAVETLAYQLADEEVAVWGEAYDELDTATLWRTVIESPTPPLDTVRERGEAYRALHASIELSKMALREAVVDAVKSGETEVQVAEAAGITRATVRSWLGK